MDGDLLQLVVLVEPAELAVGEGVADRDRSHGRAGGGRRRRRDAEGGSAASSLE